MRDHSDDPEVVFSGPGKNKVNARRDNFNDQGKGSDPDKVNSSDPAKGNAPVGWTERVAADRA